MQFRYLIYVFIACFSITLWSSCGGGQQKQEGDKGSKKDTMKKDKKTSQDVEKSKTKQGITLTWADVSPKFPEAKLNLKKPKDKAQLKAGKVPFDYEVKNYELGVQTKDAKEREIARSKKGQHIHLILNNDPYTAHYKPTFKKKMDKGHYVALSFFARSYHESVKTKQAHQLIQFNVGDIDSTTDLSKPMLFYSRPKGTYEGQGAKKLLFDFYLINTDIQEGGRHVRLTVNDKVSFTINKWIPYYLEGLPSGKNTLTIELLDKNGDLVKSPFNKVSRTITLKKEMAEAADKQSKSKSSS